MISSVFPIISLISQMSRSAGKTYLFKDRFIGTDMFSVAQPYQLMADNDAIFVVQSAAITMSAGGDIDVGCGDAFGGAVNDDGEGAAAPATGSTTVNNVIDTYGLIEVTQTKKSLMEWAKPYLARVKAELEKSSPERVAPFMAGAAKFMQHLSGSFNDWSFYINSGMDFEAGMCFARYPDGATVPQFYFFRDGLLLCFPGSGASLAKESVVTPAIAAREGYLM